jgi:Ca2+-binding EF-hand superfamily protein
MNRVPVFLLVVLLAVLPLVPSPAAAPVPAERFSQQEIQHVVLFGESRPLLIRLRLRVNGKPLRAAWEDFLDRLFRYLDLDGNGVLNRAEIQRMPPIQALLGGGSGDDGSMVSLELLKTLADKRDITMTRQGLGDFYRSQGLVPFRVVSGDALSIWMQVVDFDSDGFQLSDQPSEEALTMRLFKLLDTDKDGKLSRKELEAAPRILLAHDRDDDETISMAEIMGQGPVAAGGDVVVVDLSASVRAAESDTNALFHTVTPGKSDPKLARQLLARYGKNKKKLTAADLGLSPATFARLDQDGDGALDLEELANFALRPPDLELKVRLGERGEQQSLEVVLRDGKPGELPRELLGIFPPKGNEMELVLGKSKLTFAVQGVPGASAGLSSRLHYIAQFKAADRDRNGYLDEKEAKAHPLFRGLFRAMDRDGDGKVFVKEMLTYLDEMEGLRLAATSGCVSLTTENLGGGLFNLIDTDRDGRLSLREMRRMVKLLDTLDSNHDGCLEPSEIPRLYRATFTLGGGRTSADGYASTVVYSGGLQRRPLPVRTEGPLWFRKMDLNRDGDLSRREFLGSDEEFRKIDTDGDGLISAEEATRADAWYRARKK